jgi:hypothetical protein
MAYGGAFQSDFTRDIDFEFVSNIHVLTCAAPHLCVTDLPSVISLRPVHAIRSPTMDVHPKPPEQDGLGCSTIKSVTFLRDLAGSETALASCGIGIARLRWSPAHASGVKMNLWRPKLPAIVS